MSAHAGVHSFLPCICTWILDTMPRQCWPAPHAATSLGMCGLRSASPGISYANTTSSGQHITYTGAVQVANRHQLHPTADCHGAADSRPFCLAGGSCISAATLFVAVRHARLWPAQHIVQTVSSYVESHLAAQQSWAEARSPPEPPDRNAATVHYGRLRAGYGPPVH